MIHIPYNFTEKKFHSTNKIPLEVELVRRQFEYHKRHIVCRNLQFKEKVYYPYFQGLKRCTVCNVYFKTKETFCPCCHTKLRIRSRHNPQTKTTKHIPESFKRY